MNNRLVWDQVGEKKFETGIEKLVLYPFVVASKSYSVGYAWNGVKSIEEAPSGADESPLYADNKKYLSLTASEDFAATLEAYMSPVEFDSCDGTATPVPGVKIHQQTRSTFGLSYKTQIGNDIDQQNHGYNLHLVYGCKAAPSSRSYQSINESPEAMALSWEISTTPVDVAGYDPTSRITIDSTLVDATKMKALEDVLYGIDGEGELPGTPARLPLPAEVFALISTEG